ncbi:cohesin domain-containing protein [Gracilibacillus sp. D59]|uniref:cohesin domain-containing protein n=1 Tax=Gracilibacillus sp. D59 TaxID=3457434 RepID=UPI003FCCEE8F
MEEAPQPNADFIVPSTVDVNPDTLTGKIKGDLTINVQVPANAAEFSNSSVKLTINGQTVSADVSTVNKGYQVKMDRREFIRALDRQTGDVDVKVSITSKTGEIFVGTDTVNVQMLEPALSVKEADSVKVGDSFSLTYAVNGTGDNVSSFEINLNYDSELVEFVSVEPLVKKLNITHTSKQPGQVSLVVKGTPNHFFNQSDLFNVNMKAKETEASSTDITLTDISYSTTSKEVISVADVIQSIDLYNDVAKITVSGEDGGQSIDTNRGTLQLLSQVLPVNAMQTVEWSVTDLDGSDTDIASINSDGLLSGNTEGLNGKVKVIAEAMDGSGTVGELIVDISNQLKLVTGTPFGKNPPWSPGSEFDKALDGDIDTFYDFSEAAGGYTGIDVGEGNGVVLTQVRYYPRKGFTQRITGGKIQGSNVSPTEGFVDLYTITSEPDSGWNAIAITSEESYRYIRYLSPDGGYGNIAELEFYSAESLIQ